MAYNITHWSENTMPDSVDLPWLESLASACPLDSGSSVYLARAVLSARDTLVHREWINECELLTEPPSERRGQDDLVPVTDDDESSIKVIVYPNPTTRHVWVGVEGCVSEEKFEYVITNPLGHVIERNILNCGQTKLELNGFAGGVYFIQISGITSKFILAP